MHDRTIFSRYEIRHDWDRFINVLVNVYVKNIGVKCGGSDSELLSTSAVEKYTRDKFKITSLGI